MKISWLILILVLLLQSCDCGQQSNSPMKIKHPKEWRGTILSSKTGKFLYGEHEMLKLKESSDEGISHRIIFKHCRDGQIYTCETDEVQTICGASSNGDKVIFKWRTGYAEPPLEAILKAVVMLSSDNGDALTKISIARPSEEKGLNNDAEEKPFDAFSSWDN